MLKKQNAMDQSDLASLLAGGMAPGGMKRANAVTGKPSPKINVSGLNQSSSSNKRKGFANQKSNNNNNNGGGLNDFGINDFGQGNHAQALDDHLLNHNQNGPRQSMKSKLNININKNLNNGHANNNYQQDYNNTNQYINTTGTYNQNYNDNNSRVNTYQKQTYAKTAATVAYNPATLGHSCAKAIDESTVIPHVPNLATFFEGFDVYKGRIFEIWELMEIFEGKVIEKALKALSEENQKVDKLYNDTISYQYLFEQIKIDPACPGRFKDDVIKEQLGSAYEIHDHMIQTNPQLLEMVNDMLSLPAFASGRTAEAFDELFPPPAPVNNYSKVVAKPVHVDMDRLKKALLLKLQNHKTYQEQVLSMFINYVALDPRAYHFTKVKFVAAVNHLIVKMKPDILKFFKDAMPGMQGYGQGGPMQNQNVVQQANFGGQQPFMQSQVAIPSAPMGGSMVGGMPPQMNAMPPQMNAMSSQVIGPPASFGQMPSMIGQQQNPLQQQIPVSGSVYNPAMGNPQTAVLQQAQQLITQAKFILQSKIAGQFIQQDANTFKQDIDQAIQILMQQPQQNNLSYQALMNGGPASLTNISQQLLNPNNMNQGHPILLQEVTQAESNMNQLVMTTPAAQQQLPYNSGLNNSFIGNMPGNQMPGQQYQGGQSQLNMMPPGGYQAPGMPMPGQPGQPFPQWLQELVNRICTHLKTQHISVQQAFEKAGVPENLNGRMTYRSQDFIAHCEREFRMMAKEASHVASHFSLPDMPSYVDFMKFSSVIDQEQNKYEPLIMQFSVQLMSISKEIASRHSGVHKWFSTVMSQAIADNSLVYEEFLHGIRTLNVYSVNDMDVQSIFRMLDRDNTSKVSITEIECLFKEHTRRNNPNLRPEIVCEKIIMAFNGDVNYIDSELRQIMQQNSNFLPLESAMGFFERFPGSQAFYQQHELSFLLDSHVRNAGRVEFNDLIDMLKRTIQINKALAPNRNKKGIHQSVGKGDFEGPASSMSSFANFSEDGTSAVNRVSTAIRPKRTPNIEIKLIEDLQKACFVIGRTVEEFFTDSRGSEQGTLTKNTFMNSLEQLELKWDRRDSTNFFDQVNQSQQSGQYSNIDAKNIDETVHWLCRKKLSELHKEMLINVAVRTTSPSVQPLEMTFEAHISRQQSQYQQSFNKTCDLYQLNEVLAIYGVHLEDVDSKFLRSQYIVPGHDNDIQYQKLLDDVKQAIQMAGPQGRPQGDPNSICNAIVKQLKHLGIELSDYFSQHADKDNHSREGSFTQSRLTTILGTTLQLCPEVCSEQQLAFFWEQIDTGKRAKVSQPQVAQFVKQRAKPIDELKIDILKDISETKAYEQHFTSHSSFQKTGGSMFPIGEFQGILKTLFVSKIDSHFLSTFYMDHSKRNMNANDFIRDVNACVHDRPDRYRPDPRDPYSNDPYGKSPRGRDTYDRDPHDRNTHGRDNYGRDPHDRNTHGRDPHDRNTHGRDPHDRNTHGRNQYDQQRSGQGRQSENDAREALKLLAKLPQESRKKMIESLRQSGGRNPSMEAFRQSLRTYCSAMQRELSKALEMKYQAHNKPEELNMKAFTDALVQMTTRMKESGATLMNVDNATRSKYDSLAQQLEQGGVALAFVINLRGYDREQKGYLSDKYIVRAYTDAVKDMKVRSRIPKLTDQEIQQLLSVCHYDKRSREYNYNHVIQHTLGQEKAAQYEQMDVRDLQAEAEMAEQGRSNQFVMPTVVQPVADDRMEEIGQAMIRSGNNYEDALKAAMGPQNTDNRVTKEQLLQGLTQGAQVEFNPNQIQHILYTYFQSKQDKNGRLLVTDFLESVGLRAQTFTAPAKAKGKELSRDELTQAQKLMNKISRDLQVQNKKSRDVIERYRANQRDMGLKPEYFAKALKKECPTLRDDFNKANLTILVNYLVKEELGMISYDKLSQALNLKDNEMPLQQDQLEAIRAKTGAYLKDLQSTDIPIEISHLLIFMSQNQLSIQTFFKKGQGKKMSAQDVVTEQVFLNCCSENGYDPKDKQNLQKALAEKGQGGAARISLYKLQQFKQKYDIKENRKGAGKFDQSIQVKLDKISSWMQRNGYTTDYMHKMLDTDQNGEVDAKEFIEGFTTHFEIPGLMSRDFKLIFEAIDADNNTYLSLNEFSLFLDGAKLGREQRIAALPQSMLDDMEKQIGDLFELFDDNGDQRIDKWELVKTFQGFGNEMSVTKAEELIQQAGGIMGDSNDSGINREQFKNLMMPELQNRLLEQDDRIEDFRAMFKDADSDYSGHLTADEVYTVLLKEGIDLDYNDLIELMNEFDCDNDAKLDIDEFVAMMNTSSQMEFESDRSRHAYMEIRKSRRLNVIDFMKALKNLPAAFVPSVFHQKWVKDNVLRPSDVFKAQIDLRTMTWRDMLPLINEQMTREMQQKGCKPHIRPIPNEHGCEITIESAQGIPLPEDDKNFSRDMIVKRAVRIGIFDESQNEYFANAVQVEADWNRSQEDKWIFSKTKHFLNPVLFRSTRKDNLNLSKIKFIFEFVIYYKNRDTNEEFCCGWASKDLESCVDKTLSKHNIEVQGGSPTSTILIEDAIVNTKRAGFAGLMKHFSSKITSQIQVSFKPHSKLENYEKYHMQFLPSTCLIQKKLLLFVSGYRNYAGKALLQQQNMGKFKQPAGDVVLSCFPKIIDNIDILETLVTVWHEDVVSKMKTANRMTIDIPIKEACDIIKKIYPVLFADEFGMSEKTQMSSLVFNEHRYKLRKQLLTLALRGQQQGQKNKSNQTIEELTTFKPFNVQETNWTVWDINKFKNDQYLSQNQAKGKIRAHSSYSGGAPSPQSYHRGANISNKGKLYKKPSSENTSYRICMGTSVNLDGANDQYGGINRVSPRNGANSVGPQMPYQQAMPGQAVPLAGNMGYNNQNVQMNQMNQMNTMMQAPPQQHIPNIGGAPFNQQLITPRYGDQIQVPNLMSPPQRSMINVQGLDESNKMLQKPLFPATLN